MSDETLTPITREETYLAAIAGEDVTVPDPVTRHEEFLAAIDGHVDSVEQDVTDLAAIVPTPAALDEGKVLTAGSTAGTATWANVPKELPASLGTAGQVLTVNAGATGVEWATPSGGGTEYTIVSANFSFSSTANADIDANGGIGYWTLTTTVNDPRIPSDSAPVRAFVLNADLDYPLYVERPVTLNMTGTTLNVGVWIQNFDTTATHKIKKGATSINVFFLVPKTT